MSQHEFVTSCSWSTLFQSNVAAKVKYGIRCTTARPRVGSSSSRTSPKLEEFYQAKLEMELKVWKFKMANSNLLLKAMEVSHCYTTPTRLENTVFKRT